GNDLGVLHLSQEEGVFHFVKVTPPAPTPTPHEPARAAPVEIHAAAHDPQETESRLRKAYLHLNRKEFQAAEELARRVTLHDPCSTDALLLLGLVAKWRRLPDQAMHLLRQVTYLAPQCWVAHYYLAELHRQARDADAARRAYRRVVQLLTDPLADTGTHHQRLDLPVGEIRLLSEHHLARMSRHGH
ncbi:MAG: tetratricopeptide repeat protein, partial [Magnetococcales bacterium]|nr:tetratricopeptide repeat protein [Magnetococcales bacterium]